MSGFGINVLELMRSAGWKPEIASVDRANGPQAMTWIAGLIVIMAEIQPAAIISTVSCFQRSNDGPLKLVN